MSGSTQHYYIRNRGQSKLFFFPPGITHVFKNLKKKKKKEEKVEIIRSPASMGEPFQVSIVCTEGMMSWVLKQKALQRQLTWLLILSCQLGLTTNTLGDLSSMPLNGSAVVSSEMIRLGALIEDWMDPLMGSSIQRPCWEAREGRR